MESGAGETMVERDESEQRTAMRMPENVLMRTIIVYANQITNMIIKDGKKHMPSYSSRVCCLELLFGKKEKRATSGESSLLDCRLSWYPTRSSFGMVSPQTLPSATVVPVAPRTFSLIWRTPRSFRSLAHKSCPLMAAPPASHKWSRRFSLPLYFLCH